MTYFSRATTADEFGRAALYEWQERGGDKAKCVVSVNDGAAWIQSFVDYHCLQAIRVLDFPSAKSYVATVGKAIYGAESDTFLPWFAQMSKQLIASAEKLQKKQKPPTPKEEHPWRIGKWPLRYQ